MIRPLAFAGFAAALFVTVPAMASVTDQANGTVAAEPSAEALALARHVFELTSPDLNKKMTAHMQTVLAQSALAEADPQIASWFEKNAIPLLMPNLRKMIAEMEVRYAERLTIDELRAIIAFYDNPMGRSIAAKMIDLGLEMEEPLQRLTEAYMIDLLTAYCEEFECGKAGGVSSKPARR